MSRILLLLPTATYRVPDFLEAARRLGVEVTVGIEEKNILESQNPAGYLELDFENPVKSVKKTLEFSTTYPIKAVLGMDDATTVVASYICRALGLKSNSVESVEASRNKHLMRERLRQAGLPVPRFWTFSINDDPQLICQEILYPCVLKPTTLAASQGVIRADDETGFIQAWKRVIDIIKTQKAAPEVLVESFIPGFEVAVEGLLVDGALQVLAIFDKPDPLDGPFFEETIYVRPSRLPEDVLGQISDCVNKTIQSLGLTTGPVHTELRINQEGPWLIEVAARSIGGRCSRALRFDLGFSLEELILRQALGIETNFICPDPTPSGVMMIPIPKTGVLKQVLGKDKALSVPGVEEVLITAHIGQTLIPLPEGSAYLGFIFCRAKTPELVEAKLRESHKHLKFIIETLPGASPTQARKSCN